MIQPLRILQVSIGCISFLLALSFAPPSNATSDSECAIILCAPMGFLPHGCGAAHRAMLRRIAHFHSAIPSFSSCSKKTPKSGHDDIDNKIAQNEPKVHPTYEVKHGVGVYIAPRSVCVVFHRGHDGEYEYCAQYVDVKEKWIRDQKCVKGFPENKSSPQFCSKNLTYQETWLNGKPLGKLVYSDGHVCRYSAANVSALGDVLDGVDNLKAPTQAASPFTGMTPEQINQHINSMSPEELNELTSQSSNSYQDPSSQLKQVMSHITQKDHDEIDAFTHDARVGMGEVDEQNNNE